MSALRIRAALLAAVLVLAGPAQAEPAAEALADSAIAALGGAERFAALRGLRWSFGSSVNDTVRSSRRHTWDKHTGWHKVEGISRDGARFAIAHVLGDSTRGWATMNGQRIEGDSLRTLHRRAHGMWVNDSYWFLMPYKLRDPGVQLTLAPDTTLGGTRYRRLALAFNGVGLTPGDRYWVYLDAGTLRVERWEFVLQGQSPPPRAWTWEGWEQHAGLWFATAHRGPAGTPSEHTVVFTNAVEAVEAFAPEDFRAP
jgi:hypothetical protein